MLGGYTKWNESIWEGTHIYYLTKSTDTAFLEKPIAAATLEVPSFNATR
jgi:hypothetical protein